MRGLMYNQTADLSDAEHWRRWVVRLWVEGFFEVFATVVLSFVFVKISAISARLAERIISFSILLSPEAGIVGINLQSEVVLPIASRDHDASRTELRQSGSKLLPKPDLRFSEAWI